MKRERRKGENLRKSPWGRSHLLGVALPLWTSSHPSFKTERFFICTRVTSERDVISVHDSHFLRKRGKKGKFMMMMRTRRTEECHARTRRRNWTIENDEENIYIFKNTISLGVFRRVWVWCFGVMAVGVYSREFCLREESELFSQRDVRKLLAESKTPESECYRRNWKGRGTERYCRGVIDKKDEKKKKKDIITIDSNSISIFFYQLYFSNYICTLTRKLIDQAMFRACGRTRTRRR